MKFSLQRMPIFLLVLLLIAVTFSSCTSNTRARMWGGEQDITLPSGQRVVNVTWKQNDVWILTRTDTTTKPSTYTFAEKSNWGLLEGQINLIEQ
jgi:hypothetical protein